MKLYAVGLGPGDLEHMTPEAENTIRECDVVVGYSGYLDMIIDLTPGKEIISTGMTGEVERCRAAVAEALKGKRVCVVSSGDAGVYGMASLLCELAQNYAELEIEVVPGITAALSAAAILGSPLANDFAVISMSDLLTPLDVIEKRLDACGAADMAICLYNPQSAKRSGHLKLACGIISRHRSLETKCGYVRNAFRKGESEKRICTLGELSAAKVDMFTTVIIGNSQTIVINGKLVTPRGYDVSTLATVNGNK